MARLYAEGLGEPRDRLKRGRMTPRLDPRDIRAMDACAARELCLRHPCVLPELADARTEAPAVERILSFKTKGEARAPSGADLNSASIVEDRDRRELLAIVFWMKRSRLEARRAIAHHKEQGVMMGRHRRRELDPRIAPLNRDEGEACSQRVELRRRP